MKITFYPSTEEDAALVPPPKPASAYVPGWYKALPVFDSADGKFRIDPASGPAKTVKLCSPFADVYRTGYVQETWSDLHVEHGRDGVTVTWSAGPPMVSQRRPTGYLLPDSVWPYEFAWRQPYIARLPKGYSLLMTPPLNHPEIPIVAPTGIVDADVFWHTPSGNVPFFIERGFEGIIPAGTPMFQFIPIKREPWKAKVKEWDAEATKQRHFRMSRKFLGVYRHEFRQPKEYR